LRFRQGIADLIIRQEILRREEGRTCDPYRLRLSSEKERISPAYEDVLFLGKKEGLNGEEKKAPADFL